MKDHSLIEWPNCEINIADLNLALYKHGFFGSVHIVYDDGDTIRMLVSTTAITPELANMEYRKLRDFTELDRRKYVENRGSICPYCGDENIVVTWIYDEDGIHNYDMKCNLCESTWTEERTIKLVKKKEHKLK